MGIEFYVDADFAGGWNIATSANADNVMSCTGFVTTYANCPIYWASCLQTEIALSTAVSLKLLGLISCENLWLLIARHSASQERGANNQVIRSLDD
jgi:hypothetical protein